MALTTRELQGAYYAAYIDRRYDWKPRPWHKKPKRASTLVFRDLPYMPYSNRDNYFYALESPNGIKFGVSIQPLQRIASHCANAAHFGITPSRCWLSGPVGSAAVEVESMFKRMNGGREFTRWPWSYITTKAEILLGPGTIHEAVTV
jgi:hypothetical protein